MPLVALCFPAPLATTQLYVPNRKRWADLETRPSLGVTLIYVKIILTSGTTMARHSPGACEANKTGTLISIVLTSICTSSSSKLRSVSCCSKRTFIWVGIVLSGSKKMNLYIFSKETLVYYFSLKTSLEHNCLIRNQNQHLSGRPGWRACCLRCRCPWGTQKELLGCCRKKPGRGAVPVLTRWNSKIP